MGNEEISVASEMPVPNAEILDEARRHPSHRKSISAGGGFAAIKCYFCERQFTGSYREAVDAWNEHLPTDTQTAPPSPKNSPSGEETSG